MEYSLYHVSNNGRDKFSLNATTGELAVVVESNPDPERVDQPKIKIVTDAHKNKQDAVLVDLSQNDQNHRGVVKCVDPEVYDINAAHYAI